MTIRKNRSESRAIARATGIVTCLWLGAALLRASVLPQVDSNGWHIPATAADEASPITVTPAVLAKGQNLYKSKCQRCHGTTGTGNGPDADREHSPGDLTDSRRATRNPDGVMFYKVWEGRKDPKMPAFKTDLSREDVWTVVAFAKTLRR